MEEFYTIKTLSEMFRLLELPAPKYPLIAVLDFSKTPVTINVSDQKIICDFYQISVKGNQEGFIRYGRNHYDYQEETIVYVGPEQVVNYAEEDDGEITVDSGWSLFFHPDLIRSFPLGNKMTDYNFFDYSNREALHVSEREKELLQSIIDKIELELNSNIDDFSEELMVANLDLLLGYSKRFYNRQFITRKRFSEDIVVQFQALLDGYFEHGLQREMGMPSVKYFAERCHYSPNYLSDLVRKGTGRSVIDHVHAKLINLAKTKLLNSNKSVSEIAFELGFEYSQYFSRLFKKKTGVSPAEYRKAS